MMVIEKKKLRATTAAVEEIARRVNEGRHDSTFHVDDVNALLAEIYALRLEARSLALHGPADTPGMITITMSREEALDLRAGLADLLCWCAGFTAALGDDEQDHAPYGVSQTRTVSLKIIDALGGSRD